MSRENMTAVFGGECYIDGYGRKLYIKGYLLKDVINEKGEKIYGRVRVPKNKELSVLVEGDEFIFSAEVDDNALLDKEKYTLKKIKLEEIKKREKEREDDDYER